MSKDPGYSDSRADRNGSRLRAIEAETNKLKEELRLCSATCESHIKTVQTLNANFNERIIADRRDWRGINPWVELCKGCGGSGTKLYSSTSTWRGGIGGQAMTNGVCDKCWGSGDSTAPWVNLREVDALKKKLAKLEDK